MNTQQEQKKIRLRFIAMYATSLVLIFVIVSAFWQRKSAVALSNDSEAAETYLQFDTLLYPKLDELDNRYTLFLKNPENGTAEANAFNNTRNSIIAILDNISQQAAALTSGTKKNTMEAVVNRYKNSLQLKDNLVGQISYMHKGKTDSSASNTESNTVAGRDEEIIRLKQQAQAALKEKDDLIASLQTQLNQRPPGAISNNSSATANEWKQKYSSLKLSYDKVAESENALKNAYKTVAEDNRRLLAQLQSIKKG